MNMPAISLVNPIVSGLSLAPPAQLFITGCIEDCSNRKCLDEINSLSPGIIVPVCL